MVAKSRKPRKSKGNAGVVRRSESRRQRLDPAYESLARGESDRVTRTSKPQRPRLRDPRPVALIPGVANRDARLVAAQRIESIKALVQSSTKSAALDIELAEAIWLGLWRGNAVTSFEALAENVIGIDPKEASEAAQRVAEQLNIECQPLSDEVIACWMRMEVELSKHGDNNRVRLAGHKEGEPQLQLSLSANMAPEILVGLGRYVGVLARDRQPTPDEKKKRPR